MRELRALEDFSAVDEAEGAGAIEEAGQAAWQAEAEELLAGESVEVHVPAMLFGAAGHAAAGGRSAEGRSARSGAPRGSVARAVSARRLPVEE